MGTVKLVLLLLMLSSIVFCAEEKVGRRRKVRRKILRRPAKEVVNEFEPETMQDEGRGFIQRTVDADVLDLSQNMEEEEASQETQEDLSHIDEDRAGRGYVQDSIFFASADGQKEL